MRYTNPCTLLFLHRRDGPCPRASCIAAPTRVGIIIAVKSLLCTQLRTRISSFSIQYVQFTWRQAIKHSNNCISFLCHAVISTSDVIKNECWTATKDPCQAVTGTHFFSSLGPLKLVGPRLKHSYLMHMKTEMYLQWQTDSKSCMIYWMVPFSTTLNDH